MSNQSYDEEGLRFEYPEGWELETSDQDGIRAIAAHALDGPGFVIITVDSSRPDPAETANEALAAMREEYPDLDSTPVLEPINDHAATGHDVEFLAMDVTNSAAIRCFRGSRFTVLAFGQWSELGPDDLGDLVRDILHSIEETD